jgi:hypothetical protein
MTEFCRFQVALAESGFYCRNPTVHSSGQLVSEEICARCVRKLDTYDLRPMPTALPRSIPPIPLGPGGHLKKLIASLGVKPGNCNCEPSVATMNHNGPDWCEANIETIVDWLRVAAKEQRYIFSATVARILVRRAIRNARRENSEAEARRLAVDSGTTS